jgi:hypothetical protein
MWKINFFMILVAIAAISISRKMRMSSRYERHSRELSDWKSLDKGIDPTDRQER